MSKILNKLQNMHASSKIAKPHEVIAAPTKTRKVTFKEEWTPPGDEIIFKVLVDGKPTQYQLYGTVYNKKVEDIALTVDEGDEPTIYLPDDEKRTLANIQKWARLYLQGKAAAKKTKQGYVFVSKDAPLPELRLPKKVAPKIVKQAVKTTKAPDTSIAKKVTSTQLLKAFNAGEKINATGDATMHTAIAKQDVATKVKKVSFSCLKIEIAKTGSTVSISSKEAVSPEIRYDFEHAIKKLVKDKYFGEYATVTVMHSMQLPSFILRSVTLHKDFVSKFQEKILAISKRMRYPFMESASGDINFIDHRSKDKGFVGASIGDDSALVLTLAGQDTEWRKEQLSQAKLWFKKNELFIKIPDTLEVSLAPFHSALKLFLDAEYAAYSPTIRVMHQSYLVTFSTILGKRKEASVLSKCTKMLNTTLLAAKSVRNPLFRRKPKTVSQIIQLYTDNPDTVPATRETVDVLIKALKRAKA